VPQRVMHLLGWGAYLPGVRDSIIQAQYFKSPFNMDAYLEHNTFLTDINNEIAEHRQAQYRDNILALDRMALVRFKYDTTGVLFVFFTCIRAEYVCACVLILSLRAAIS
jgi:hypothetical protein